MIPDRSLFEGWPPSDYKAWALIRNANKPSERGRPGARLSPASQYKYAVEYREFLLWCKSNKIATNKGIATTAGKPAIVARYAEFLRATVSASTCFNRLTGLSRALALIRPDIDRSHITEEGRKSPRKTKTSEEKRERRVREPHQLLALGLALMTISARTPYSVPMAVLYRIGLSIAILSVKPLRAKNLVSLEIGRHIIKSKGSWRIMLDAEDMKNHQDYSGPLHNLRWLRLFGQIFRFDKWIVCRG